MTVLRVDMGCGPSMPSSRLVSSSKTNKEKDDVYEKSLDVPDTGKPRNKKTSKKENDKTTPLKSNKNSQISNDSVSKNSNSKSSSVMLDDSQSEASAENAIQVACTQETRVVSRTTAFRDKIGPLLQSHQNSAETESLLEFFRILDEKIEQGHDYIPES